MNDKTPIKIARDCAAAMIPSGEKISLPAGSSVWMTQALGASYTVMTDRGYMVRIDGHDADALGMAKLAEPKPESSTAAESLEEIERQVWDQLRSCFDPEIPVNIVDLGLVYSCLIMPLPEGGNKVDVKFTLTAPGCGMGRVLKADMESKIVSLPGVKDVDVEVVFDPPWDPSMMSDAAKIQLGFM
jgi:probable FeS assembly SUF system protein SufT